MIITKTEPFTKEEIEKQSENNKQLVALSSMVMDLKRASLGFYRGSNKMGERFILEANKRKSEINSADIPNYVQNIFKSLEAKRSPDDLLMYSVLLQNYLNSLASIGK